MAQYSLCISPEYNMNVNINKTTLRQDICVCCLAENAAFVGLASCKHSIILELLCKFKETYQNAVICYQCHNFLKKIETFKAQVEGSFEILNEQVQKCYPQTIYNLQQSETKCFNILLEQELEDSKSESIAAMTISTKEQCTELITDVKIEHDSCSDFEIDMPLSEIKKEITVKKVGRKKKKKIKATKKTRKQDVKAGLQEKKRSSLHEKYEGKIAIVTLSREEMMLEREADAKKESYLRLPYKCESCITGFDHELTLEDHMKKRHGERKGGFVCDICKSVLGTITSYKEHTKRHTRRYECQECGKRNNNVYSVAKHYNDKHGALHTQFTCQDCGFTTDSHRGYRYHRDKHKQKQQCAICGSTFVNSAGLRIHMFTVHKQSSRVYSCEECGKVYNAKSGLAAHIASAHQRSRGAWCQLCRTHFRTAYNLAHHLRTHSRHVASSDRKFVCDECGSKFLTKVALQEHVDFVHLKTSKYECDKCPRVFKNGSALKKHDNFVHKKLRPPRNKICDHCGRGFTTLTILQSHIRTHTGERPLRCQHCSATFAHSAALYTHTKLLHNTNRTTSA